MKTTKNTFRYLLFVFAFAILHFNIARLDVVLGTAFFIACIFYGAKCTGLGGEYKKLGNIAAVIVGSFLLALLLPPLERFAFSLLRRGGSFVIEPLAMLPVMLALILLSLLLCKLCALGGDVRFPRGGFLLACLVPTAAYFFLGLILSLIDIPALELALPGVYSGQIYLMYNYELYPPMKDITIGWSIFCMMKYNQTMRIKALFEMQNIIT